MKGVLSMIALALALTMGPTAAVAAEKDEPQYQMRAYVLGFLYVGPTKIDDAAKMKELQAGHMANIGRLAEEGKLILAGPFMDKGDLRGIFLFNTERLEEAKGWCDTDPAVMAGALRVDLKPWFSAKGIMVDQPAARKSNEARARFDAAREAEKAAAEAAKGAAGDAEKK
ncbi:MAG TPA: YciI family protein [Candidatus Eisenbacteria bacterium]|nr:YciI family protein [Candidatus Eisenbacteria bacterium]